MCNKSGGHTELSAVTPSPFHMQEGKEQARKELAGQQAEGAGVQPELQRSCMCTGPALGLHTQLGSLIHPSTGLWAAQPALQPVAQESCMSAPLQMPAIHPDPASLSEAPALLTKITSSSRFIHGKNVSSFDCTIHFH